MKMRLLFHGTPWQARKGDVLKPNIAVNLGVPDEEARVYATPFFQLAAAYAFRRYLTATSSLFVRKDGPALHIGFIRQDEWAEVERSRGFVLGADPRSFLPVEDERLSPEWVSPRPVPVLAALKTVTVHEAMASGLQVISYSDEVSRDHLRQMCRNVQSIGEGLQSGVLTWENLRNGALGLPHRYKAVCASAFGLSVS